MAEKQVKSKERVAKHGEVYTAEREVNAMLDLVKQETVRIDSRFLEPACGTGNFLVEILRRKLAVVTRKYAKSPADWEKYAIVALTSIYGVELLEDNVKECQHRLYQIFDEAYKKNCKKDANEESRQAAKFILSRNILCGNALTLKQVEKQANIDQEPKDSKLPIIFSEWSLVTGNLLQRRDFRLDVMVEGKKESIPLFHTKMANSILEWNDEIKAFMPKPIRTYPPMDYRKVQDAE